MNLSDILFFIVLGIIAIFFLGKLTKRSEEKKKEEIISHLIATDEGREILAQSLIENTDRFKNKDQEN